MHCKLEVEPIKKEERLMLPSFTTPKYFAGDYGVAYTKNMCDRGYRKERNWVRLSGESEVNPSPVC